MRRRLHIGLGRSCVLGPTASLALLAAAVVAVSGGALPAQTGAAQPQAVKAMWGPFVMNGVSQFPTYRQLGVQIYQDDLYWYVIAARRPRNALDPSDPAYQWPTEVTKAVAQARRYHIRVALEIIGTPSWANGGKAWNWAPQNPQDFARFAAAAAKRYPSVHLWMIWGEPNRVSNFMPETGAVPFAKLDAAQQVAPHRYARMLDAAYGALKGVSAANLVIGGMTYTTGDISTYQWIRNLRLPDGKPPRLDLYGHNPFSFRAPDLANLPSPNQEVDFSDVGRLGALVSQYLGRPGNPNPRLFLSEWTVPTSVDLEFNFYTTTAVQAQWITDALGIARAWSGIYAVGWIHLYDAPPISGGGLIETNGTKKPGFFAWRSG